MASEIQGNTKILAIDADNAGRMVGRAVLTDDEDALHEVSARIELGEEIIEKWAQENGGMKISAGGDEATVKIPAEAMDHIEELRREYNFATQLTITVGVGNTLSEAGKSLIAGKFRGKDQVVEYDESVENDIQAAQQRIQEGNASEEEKKQGEAYLQSEGNDMKESELDDCQYCREMKEKGKEDPEHCKYCHGIDAEEGEDDCPYCKQADAESQNEESDDCPYCEDENSDGAVEAEAQEAVQNPTTQTSQDYEDQGLTPPDLDKPEVNEDPQGLAAETDMPSPNNDVLDQQGEGNEETTETEESEEGEKGVPSEQTEETMEQIGEALEGDDQKDEIQTEKDIMDELDAEDLAVGTRMDDNASHQEEYEDNVPDDMGLAEDEVPEESPDLSEVLKDGLDNQADGIRKEKAIQLVSEALEGFKNSKDVLERAKDQAPDFYNASLSMLKAMIEMAKMLGLDGEAEAQAQEEQPAEEAPAEDGSGEQNEWSDPFPQHPDHGPAADDGGAASQDPKLNR